METAAFEKFYRDEFGRILSTVIRAVGNFELAEDAVQEAFAAALEQWPRDGTPDNPRAWIAGAAVSRAGPATARPTIRARGSRASRATRRSIAFGGSRDSRS